MEKMALPIRPTLFDDRGADKLFHADVERPGDAWSVRQIRRHGRRCLCDPEIHRRTSGVRWCRQDGEWVSYADGQCFENTANRRGEHRSGRDGTGLDTTGRLDLID